MSEDQIIDPYTNIPLVEVTPAEAVTTQAGSANIPAVDEMTVGVGDEVFHANREGIWLGAKLFADALFSVTLAGVIRGIAGFIGGFEIGATYIRNVGNTFGLSSESTGADDIYFWAGTTYLDRANAEFWVTESGVVRAQSGTIGGWSLTATTFSSGGISLDSVAETITVGSGTPNLVIDGVNKRIRTSTYSTGLRGFSIEGSDGSAEFNNIRARGEFHSQVLSYGEVHVNAGSQIVSKSAAKLKTDFTSVTSPTTFNVDVDDPTTGHLQVFVVGDILQVKDGSGNENWMTISSVSDQTTFFRYICVKQSGTNATFRAGAAIADWGASGDGVIYQTADATNAPHLSIQTHTGSPWSAVEERVRIGNLNGMLDFVSKTFGIAAGSLLNGWFSWDETLGLRVKGGLNNQSLVEAGENLLEGDLCIIRTNEIIKQVASHDARVLENSAGTNYGTATTAPIGSMNALGTADSYLFVKFDLSTITVPVADSAMIRLYVVPGTMTAAGSSYQIGIFQVTGADWDESTITWTGKPAIGAIFEDWELSNGDSITDDFIEESAGQQYVYLDITTLYNQWKAGSQSDYGVCIRWTQRSDNLEPAGSASNVEIATSEHATAAFRPTIIVSGVSSNVGKAYKADASDFTGVYGQFGVCYADVNSGSTAVIQTSGVVENQSGLTPGKTYYIDDSGALSTTPGTIVREVGVAYSATTLDLDTSFQRIVSDYIFLISNDSSSDHDSTNTIFIPLGFKPKLIRFDGASKAGGVAALNLAIGIWQNSVQQAASMSSGILTSTSGYLVYDVPNANESATLTVTSVNDTGVLLTFRLKDNTTSDSSHIKGILTFER